MAAEAPRALKTVTGAGGQGTDIYDQAIDVLDVISLGNLADDRQHEGIIAEDFRGYSP
jgi:hypothetical protein